MTFFNVWSKYTSEVINKALWDIKKKMLSESIKKKTKIDVFT